MSDFICKMCGERIPEGEVEAGGHTVWGSMEEGSHLCGPVVPDRPQFLVTQKRDPRTDPPAPDSEHLLWVARDWPEDIRRMFGSFDEHGYFWDDDSTQPAKLRASAVGWYAEWPRPMTAADALAAAGLARAHLETLTRTLDSIDRNMWSVEEEEANVALRAVLAALPEVSS